MKLSKPLKTTNQPQLQPHKLRDDPKFLDFYREILGALYGDFDLEAWSELELEQMHSQCQVRAIIAHMGARHAHAQLQFAEPYGDEEIDEFNTLIHIKGDE